MKLFARRFTRSSLFPEIPFFAGLLLVLNLHALFGVALEPQNFLADRVAAGEWWRVLAHPFVHISWYHLLLDGAAFLIIYSTLERTSAAQRVLLGAGAAAGSLLVALALCPAVWMIGLCGLSGTAHGLMAVSSLEMMRHRRSDRGLAALGAVSFALVAGKSIVELVTGCVVFEFLLLGMTGTPIAASHFGGVAGGLLTFGLLELGGRVTADQARSARLQGG